MTHLARGRFKLHFLGIIYLGTLSPLGAESFRVVGSSAMYPFMTMASEAYRQIDPQFDLVIESTGTGGGIKFFCSSQDNASPTFVTASRRMSKKERDFCKSHGVHHILEIPIGLDGIVLAKSTTKTLSLTNLTHDQLKNAVREHENIKLPKRWSDLDPKYPRDKIKILAPSTASGTREAFEQLVLKGLKSRQDRALRSAADQEAVIAQKLHLMQDAIGIMSFAYFEKNTQTLVALSLDGVLPSRTTIQQNKYPLVRQVYLYVKASHLKERKNGTRFLSYLLSQDAGALLVLSGLVPLDPKKQRAQRSNLFAVLKRVKRS